MRYITPADLKMPPICAILEQLISYFKKHDTLDIKTFSKALTPEIEPTFDKANLSDISTLMPDKAIFNKVLQKSIFEVKKESLKRKLNDLATNLRQLEMEEKEKEAGKIQEQMRELLTALNSLEKSSYNKLQ